MVEREEKEKEKENERKFINFKSDQEKRNPAWPEAVLLQSSPLFSLQIFQFSTIKFRQFTQISQSQSQNPPPTSMNLTITVTNWIQMADTNSNTPTATAPEKSPSASPTSSRSVTHTVNGSHKFVIQGYSLAKGMGPGKHIASDDFTVGGYQWAVYFYPDGKNVEDNSTYVSIFIALASDGTDVRALFELTLVDQSGKGKHKVHSHFERSLESGPYTLKYRGSMWYVFYFIYCDFYWLGDHLLDRLLL